MRRTPEQRQCLQKYTNRGRNLALHCSKNMTIVNSGIKIKLAEFTLLKECPQHPNGKALEVSSLSDHFCRYYRNIPLFTVPDYSLSRMESEDFAHPGQRGATVHKNSGSLSISHPGPTLGPCLPGMGNRIVGCGMPKNARPG